VVGGSVPYNALELEIRGGHFETLGLKKLHDCMIIHHSAATNS
jgi:hypothetical protein